MNRAVDVYLDQHGGPHPGGGGRGCAPVLVGRTWFTTARRKLATTFRYDSGYLASKGAFALDPALSLLTGQHALADGLPYSFTDCAPDRWGRNLIRKRLHALDVEAGRARREVTDVDYLLGVTDLTRQGALRFTEPDAGPGGPFLSDDQHVPKLLELPRLLRAAEVVEAGEEDLEAVKALLDAGTGSLGGARPKASVRDGDRLLIAKFASPRDAWDVIAWEKTSLDLAERAGIVVPARQLKRVSGKSVLLLERFDRTSAGQRMPYASAMTLLGARDGDDSYDYLDVAEAITDHGASVNDDLRQLWRRMAFSAAVNNTDDHLRNHGFLRGRGGWTLSPLFDVNPNPDPARERTTSVGGTYAREDSMEGLMSVTQDFRLTADQARTVLGEVLDAVREWRQAAADNGIPARELPRMAEVLDGTDRWAS